MLATKFEANSCILQLLRSDLVLLWVKTEGKKGEKKEGKGRKRKIGKDRDRNDIGKDKRHWRSMEV